MGAEQGGNLKDAEDVALPGCVTRTSDDEQPAFQRPLAVGEELNVAGINSTLSMSSIWRSATTQTMRMPDLGRSD